MNSIQKQYFLEILKKYNAGQASLEEIGFVESFYELYESGNDWNGSQLEEEFIKFSIKTQIDGKIPQDGVQKQYVEPENEKYAPTIRWIKLFAVAASILLAVSAAIFVVINKNDSSKQLFAAGKQLKPGTNTATLTLADGSKILLNNAANGIISNQGGITVSKLSNGRLLYTVKEDSGSLADLSDSIRFNTIETPKGGQYQVRLPDGTNVWLNASSSLRYPTVFTGRERKVNLDGEAYFEVAKNPEMPFRVNSKNQIVKVLGTHFNISSYPDDPEVKTTLTEGRVSLSSASSGQTVMLNPGEQALTHKNGAITVHQVNADQFLGWKEGKFIFTDADIQSIMRQVARWYNVEVVYQGEISKEKFGGSTSRFTNVAELLEILELTNQVHFKIQGRRIIVMP